MRILGINAIFHDPAAKSSRSENVSECVEIADLPPGGRAVRDSKNPTGPALTFTATEWAAFTAGVRADEFD